MFVQDVAGAGGAGAADREWGISPNRRYYTREGRKEGKKPSALNIVHKARRGPNAFPGWQFNRHFSSLGLFSGPFSGPFLSWQSSSTRRPPSAPGPSIGGGGHMLQPREKRREAFTPARETERARQTALWQDNGWPDICIHLTPNETP